MSASGDTDPPHSSQWVGPWSRNSSGLSASRRLCGSCPGFAPPGRGVLAPLLLVRRRGLGRRARGLVRRLKPEHQLDQLLLAELLQITAVHAAMDSEIAPPGKGAGNCCFDNPLVLSR